MKIRIIGSGGVGFWLGLALAQSAVLPEDVIVYDDDDLQGGMGYMRLPRAPATTKKVNLLKGVRRNLFGSSPTAALEQFTGEEPEAGDLVVDCSDMHDEVRKEVWAKARAKKATMLRVSYDGAGSTIVVTSGLPFSFGRPAGYANMPTLALSIAAGGIGAEIINHILSHPGGTEFITLQVSLAEYVKPLVIPESKTPVRKKRKRTKTRAASA